MNGSKLTDAERAVAALKARYTAALPDKLSALHRAIPKPDDAGSVEAFATLAHRLAGSAGMYEFIEIGAIARRLERAARAGEDPSRIVQLLKQIEREVDNASDSLPRA